MATTTPEPGPVAVVVIGMAGSGKTTFMQRIVADLYAKEDAPAPYVMNLDPAVAHVPFESNVDIRDSVNYKEVMRQYNLGPNGGILTSLNLFATKIDQVIGLVEKRFGIAPGGERKAEAETAASTAKTTPTTQGEDSSDTPAKSKDDSDSSQPSPAHEFATAPAAASADPDLPRHLLIDTPGQIEVFTWSASSSILLSALSTSLPTVIAYVIDTPRTAASTATFMANMLYAVSVLYRTGLPMILVLNKSDVRDGPAEPPLGAGPDLPDSDGEDGNGNSGGNGTGTGTGTGGTAGNIYGDDGNLVDRTVRWMRSWESLCEAITAESASTGSGGFGTSNYQSSLTNSMSLVLDEFYNALEVVGVSAMTGAGVDDFFAAVEAKRRQFLAEYWPNIVKQRDEAAKAKAEWRAREMDRLMRDLSIEDGARANDRDGRPPVDEPETVSDLEEVDEGEDDGEGGDGDEDEEYWDENDDGTDFVGRSEESLQGRYRRAMNKSRDPAEVDANMSFARYVMNQKMSGM